MLRLVPAALRPKLEGAVAGKGCADCSRSGYAGRMPLFEVMDVRTPEMRGLILAGSGADALTERAREEGMRSLGEAAAEAVAAGETTVEEALNILLAD